MEKKIVYVDMDNVLVDFTSGIMKIDHDTFARFDDRLDEVPGIFSLMTPMDDAIESYEKALELNPDIINVNGGAISLGHPLGCSGAKLSVQIFNELKRQNKKYGMVTMCVGTGQGAAGIFEML